MPLPINAIGNFVNFLRSIGYQRQFDRFLSGPIAEANQYGQQTAESLGPIADTTTLARESRELATDMAGQFSNQYLTDVNNRFDVLGGAAMANLRSRGLTGSSIETPVQLGINEARSAELRRANDQRLDTLLGVESAFTGQEISANQEAADARARFNANRYLVAPQAPTPFFSSGRNF